MNFTRVFIVATAIFFGTTVTYNILDLPISSMYFGFATFVSGSVASLHCVIAKGGVGLTINNYSQNNPPKKAESE